MRPKLWKHQRDCLAASAEMPAAAIHWEPRVGKSRVIIETAEYLAGRNTIDAAVVIAPNGVHLNWTRDQLPAYWDRPGTVVIEWRSGRAGTQRFQRELAAALDHPGFVWITSNIEAVSTKRLYDYLTKFIKARRVLLVVDESHYVKNPKAQRTRAVMKLSKGCPFRRTLTGTPTPQGPFDLWSQFRILDPAILDGLLYHPFKQRYGVWKKVKYGQGPLHDELVEYRNLDELAARIAPFTFESNKADLFDLPDRVFARRYFEMPKEHARVYATLRDELVALLESGETIAAPLAIVNLMRLQQISRGHVTSDTGEHVDLPGPYPADDAVIEMIQANTRRTIVWCRFVRDCARLEETLLAAGIPTIRCDGGTPSGDRPDLLVRFRDPDDPVRVWVGTPATGGLGIDLGMASLMIFHSHGFDLAQRLQALERNYGTTQEAGRVDVVDLVAVDTIDERALAVLERKEDLAKLLTRDALKELLK